MKQFIFAILFVGLCVAGAQAAPALTLLPVDGMVGGAPGATIGWGFTLTDTTDYVFLTGSEFFPSTFEYGTYTDFLANQSVLAGPAPETPTVTESFDSNLQVGAGEFQIAGTAFAGAVTAGTLDVYYSEFSGDPNVCGSNCETVPDGVFALPVRVDVTPEPAAGFLMLAGVLVLGLMWRRSRTSERR